MSEKRAFDFQQDIKSVLPTSYPSDLSQLTPEILEELRKYEEIREPFSIKIFNMILLSVSLIIGSSIFFWYLHSGIYERLAEKGGMTGCITSIAPILAIVVLYGGVTYASLSGLGFKVKK